MDDGKALGGSAQDDGKSLDGFPWNGGKALDRGLDDGMSE